MQNYTVKVKKVSSASLVKYVNYIKSKTHKNHVKKSTRVVFLNETMNSRKFLNNCLQAEDVITRRRLINRLGGRPSSDFARSYSFNIPPEYKSACTDKVLIYLNKTIQRDIADYLKITKDELEKYCYSVAHQQANPHIHFLLSLAQKRSGKFEKIREIKSPAFLKFIKHSFTKNLDEILETNILQYKSKNSTKYVKTIEQISTLEKDTIEKQIKELKKELEAFKQLKNLTQKDEKFLDSLEKDINKQHTIKASKKAQKFMASHM